MGSDEIVLQALAASHLAEWIYSYVGLIAGFGLALLGAWFGARWNENHARKRENRQAFGELLGYCWRLASFVAYVEQACSKDQEHLSQIPRNKWWGCLPADLERPMLPAPPSADAIRVMVDFGQGRLSQEVTWLENECRIIDSAISEHYEKMSEYTKLVAPEVSVNWNENGVGQVSIPHHKIKNKAALAMQPELQHLIEVRFSQVQASFSRAQTVFKLLRHFAGQHQEELGLKAVPVIELVPFREQV